MFFPPFFNSFCELIFPFIFLFPRFFDRRGKNPKPEQEFSEAQDLRSFFGDFRFCFNMRSLALDVCRTRGRISVRGASSFFPRCNFSFRFRQKVSVAEDPRELKAHKERRNVKYNRRARGENVLRELTWSLWFGFWQNIAKRFSQNFSVNFWNVSNFVDHLKPQIPLESSQISREAPKKV